MNMPPSRLLRPHPYLICHSGREKHGLTVVRAQLNYLFHLFLKVFIQHPRRGAGNEAAGEDVALPINPAELVL